LERHFDVVRQQGLDGLFALAASRPRCDPSTEDQSRGEQAPMGDDLGMQLGKRRVGRTDLWVTPIGMGTGPIGDPRGAFGYDVDEERALATVRAFFDGPLTLIDTAAIYGDGVAERRIGAIIRERGGLPPGVVLETKADRDASTGDWSADQMRRSVERSLGLLGLDRLPICLIHDTETSTWDHVTGPGGPLDALVEMKRQGLIGRLGIGAGPVDMLIRYAELDVIEVVMSHNRYNLLDRRAAPLLEVCARRDVAVFNAGSYGGGLLSKGPSAHPRFRYQRAAESVLESVRAMEIACQRHGVPLAAAALQFSLREPRITATVVGMSRPERMRETAELATLPIPDALWPELDAIAATVEGLPPGQ
jgi:D-threo-aldose 1-dehydrogenase